MASCLLLFLQGFILLMKTSVVIVCQPHIIIRKNHVWLIEFANVLLNRWYFLPQGAASVHPRRTLQDGSSDQMGWWGGMVCMSSVSRAHIYFHIIHTRNCSVREYAEEHCLAEISTKFSDFIFHVSVKGKSPVCVMYSKYRIITLLIIIIILGQILLSYISNIPL